MREEGTKAHTAGVQSEKGKGGDRKAERGVPGGGGGKKRKKPPNFPKAAAEAQAELRRAPRAARPARLHRARVAPRAQRTEPAAHSSEPTAHSAAPAAASRGARPSPLPHRPALTLRHPAQPQDVLGPDGLQLQQFGFGPRRSGSRGRVRRPAPPPQAAQGPPAPRRRLLVGSRRRPRPGAAHRPAAAAKMAAASRRSYGSGGRRRAGQRARALPSDGGGGGWTRGGPEPREQSDHRSTATIEFRLFSFRALPVETAGRPISEHPLRAAPRGNAKLKQLPRTKSKTAVPAPALDPAKPPRSETDIRAFHPGPTHNRPPCCGSAAVGRQGTPGARRAAPGPARRRPLLSGRESPERIKPPQRPPNTHLRFTVFYRAKAVSTREEKHFCR